jgi:hypothetical protein
MVLTGQNRSTGREACSSATLSTTKLRLIYLGSNLGLRCDGPTTDCLSNGTALQGNISVNGMSRFRSYRAVNTLRLGYKKNNNFMPLEK